MKITSNEKNRNRRILEILKLEWISNTGRYVLRFFTRGRVSFPGTDDANYASELKKTKSFCSRVWLTVRFLALDSIYFPIGLVFWIVIFLVVPYLLAMLLGLR